jgi:hypothetical protein
LDQKSFKGLGIVVGILIFKEGFSHMPQLMNASPFDYFLAVYILRSWDGSKNGSLTIVNEH